MKKNATIQLGALPKREKSLSLAELTNIFGGCKEYGARCDYDRNCCSGSCEPYETYGDGYCSSSSGPRF